MHRRHNVESPDRPSRAMSARALQRVRGRSIPTLQFHSLANWILQLVSIIVGQVDVSAILPPYTRIQHVQTNAVPAQFVLSALEGTQFRLIALLMQAIP